jgi:hypothetical protein
LTVGGCDGEQERMSVVPSQSHDQRAAAAGGDRESAARLFCRTFGLPASRAGERFPADRAFAQVGNHAGHLEDPIEPVYVARMALFLAADDSAMCTANNYMVEAGSI